MQKLPNCSAYGADPIHQSGKVFKQIGRYFEMAISNVTGNENATVLLNPQQKSDYSMRTVNTVEYNQFFAKRLELNFVDFMFLDAEGAEYRLLPYYFYNDSAVTVCQLSIELHGPAAKYGLANEAMLEAIVRKFLEHSSFIPLWSSGNPNRLFAINAHHELCVRRFFRQWCSSTTDLETP